MDHAERVRRDMFGDAVYEAMVERGDFESYIACPPEERKVRDEFARESSIEFQLRAFAAGGPLGRVMQNGVYDDSIDRLEAEALVEAANNLWRRVPLKVRERFQSVEGMLGAARSGELVQFLQELKTPVPPVPEVVNP